jgi:hypothetical protein
MAVTESLSSFFADFGVVGTLSGGSVTGIFDRDSILALGGEVSATEPAFRVQSADVTARSIVAGTAITIGGQAYTVVDLRPDGTGLTVLMLAVSV